MNFINVYWGLGFGDWVLGIWPTPQSPIPNPQSPIPNPHEFSFILLFILKKQEKIFQLFYKGMDELTKKLYQEIKN